jgi:pSer/pThr/pTyr-binding forkhead associated (FHA) protein
MSTQRICPKCHEVYPISVNFCKKDKLLLDEFTIQQVSSGETAAQSQDDKSAQENMLAIQALPPSPQGANGRTERAKPAFVRLEILSSGKLIRIDSNTIIGREFQAEFENENTVSRRHCILFTDVGGRSCIRDNNSTNGTMVNNHPLTGEGSLVIKKGDTLRLGDIVCRVVEVG